MRLSTICLNLICNNYSNAARTHHIRPYVHIWVDKFTDRDLGCPQLSWQWRTWIHIWSGTGFKVRATCITKKTSYLTHFIKINSLGTAAPVIQIADDVEHGLLPEKHAGHVTKIKHGLRKWNTLILEEIIFGGCPAIEQRKGDREEGQRFPQHVWWPQAGSSARVPCSKRPENN